MLKHTFSSIHFARLLVAAAVTLLIADFVPHPALGPSLIHQVFSDLIQPVTAAEFER